MMLEARRFHVYIMASRPWGTLYIGVTGDLLRCVFEHRNGLIDGFTKAHGVRTLVWFEEWGTAGLAIHREKRLKKWTRSWKINLIRTDNPDWIDLAASWYPAMPTTAQIDSWLAEIAAAPEIGSPGSPHNAGTRAMTDD
ncbi:MAG TPA: GIY-YIG nuclease family protein [Rhizomicrobium sp.]|jgi:putative endonuclease